MTQKISAALEWHDGREIPDPSSGSFLILTKNGGIAEAEYIDRTPDCNGGCWVQYRWSATLEREQVVAWCRFSDIRAPLL